MWGVLGVLNMALCSFVDRHHTTWCHIPEDCTQLWFLSSQLCLIRCRRSTMLLYSFIAGPSFISMYWTRSFCAIIRSASPSICCKSMKDSHLVKFIIFVLMWDCSLLEKWKAYCNVEHKVWRMHTENWFLVLYIPQWLSIKVTVDRTYYMCTIFKVSNAVTDNIELCLYNVMYLS